MPAAETRVPVETEIERIEAWGQEELERAGYSEEAAAQLAGRHDVDLHYAIALIERGCDAGLALQILL
jgi:hypothetical protein